MDNQKIMHSKLENGADIYLADNQGKSRGCAKVFLSKIYLLMQREGESMRGRLTELAIVEWRMPEGITGVEDKWETWRPASIGIFFAQLQIFWSTFANC